MQDFWKTKYVDSHGWTKEKFFLQFKADSVESVLPIRTTIVKYSIRYFMKKLVFYRNSKYGSIIHHDFNMNLFL
jgi:hypothetical protein